MKKEGFDRRILILPIYALVSILSYLVLYYLNFKFIAQIVIIVSIIVGSINLVIATVKLILKKQFALDYIALLAIATALFTQEYLAGSIIVLMLSGGNALESYAKSLAKRSLTSLTDRIPHEVVLWRKGKADRKEKIENIKPGELVLVRKGEVIPLDGILESEIGETDESSLTGEPYIIEKLKGDKLRSGTVNKGEAIILKVTRAESDSTYRKIVEMVRLAQEEKSPFIRLANKYSAFFTIFTLLLCAATFYFTQDWKLVLAVLVIATPCPLIIATPVALIGGVNSAAKNRTIIKTLASLEALSTVDTLVFDKTGTITLGKPAVMNAKIFDKKYDLRQVYGIAEAIERNSLHPIAKSLVEAAKSLRVERFYASDISEKIGSSISGKIKGVTYTLKKPEGQSMNSIHLLKGNKLIAEFFFQDLIKRDAFDNIIQLSKSGFSIHIFTGDKKESAEQILKQFPRNIILKTEMTPEEKKDGIQSLKNHGKIIAMVGDGINDAPSLALADVGLVFSNEEHTAASEAADVVFLGGDFSSVTKVIQTAKRSVSIAEQSIVIGLGLSAIGMIFASFGFIVPIVGAFIQEAIDVTVILNALRTSK